MLQLTPHPTTPSRRVERVGVQIMEVSASTMMVEFAVSNPEALLLPEGTAPTRTDGLWQTTCFEAFLGSPGGKGYVELNFSPSFAWAAYEFDGYREGMRPLALKIDPNIAISPAEPLFFLAAEFEMPPFEGWPLRVGLSAVIEEKDGTKSYWALAHPPEGPPDFHHPDCFVLELPPPAGR